MYYLTFSFYLIGILALIHELRVLVDKKYRGLYVSMVNTPIKEILNADDNKMFAQILLQLGYTVWGMVGLFTICGWWFVLLGIISYITGTYIKDKKIVLQHTILVVDSILSTLILLMIFYKKFIN